MGDHVFKFRDESIPQVLLAFPVDQDSKAGTFMIKFYPTNIQNFKLWLRPW